MNNLAKECDRFLIDGNYLKFDNEKHLSYKYETIVKGDDKVYEISCASILAKVTRDRLMIAYDLIYPEYGFKNHKGYGTKMHIDNIKKLGPCEIHRKSFLKNVAYE
jgi:ribonuclease HII